MSSRILAGLVLTMAVGLWTPTHASPVDRIKSKPALEKHALTTPKPDSLAEQIEALLRAPQGAAGHTATIMSPFKPMRISIVETDESRLITLVDAKTAAVVGQWSITGQTPASDIAAIETTVLGKMGLETSIGGRTLTNKPVSHKAQSKAN